MTYTKRIRKRLMNLGVARRDASSVAVWFNNQVVQQGEDRALSYLKRVGDGILWSLDRNLSKPEWVKFRSGFPACISCLRKYDEVILLRVAKFSRVIQFDSLHSQQVRKISTGILAPYSGTSNGIEQISHFIKVGVSALRLQKCSEVPHSPQSIFDCFGMVRSVSGSTVVEGKVPLTESIDLVMGNPSLYNLPYWQESFAPIARYELSNEFEFRHDADSTPVGEIHAAQEPGGKLRLFAAPYSIVQCLLRPIHDWIMKFRNPLVTDCTYNQVAGAIWAQAHLQNGNTVHSVDLSTATCRFPLVVQLETLKHLGLGQVYLDTLEWACTGTWLVGDELQPEFPAELAWKVGQPLGITPSMSMFSLCHNLLLTGCCASLGIELDSFRVLGDDVVLVNHDLHSLYTKVIQDAGITISWSKSHSSSLFAEFAGYSITIDNLVRPGKWAEPKADNHVSLADSLGTPTYGEVKNSWIEIQKFYLWQNNKYEPSPEEFNKFLRANSDTDVVPLWPSLITAPSRNVGVLRTVRNCGLDWDVIPRDYVTRNVILNGCDFIGLDEVKALCTGLPPFSDERHAINYCLDHVYGHLSRLLSKNLISRREYDSQVSIALANAYTLFFLPPRKSFRVNGLHNKLSQLLAAVA